MSALVGCGRCQKGVRPRDAEGCWFCDAPLCAGCWDETGHCGHEEADKMNEAMRMLDFEGRRTAMLTFLNQS